MPEKDSEVAKLSKAGGWFVVKFYNSLWSVEAKLITPQITFNGRSAGACLGDTMEKAALALFENKSYYRHVQKTRYGFDPFSLEEEKR